MRGPGPHDYKTFITITLNEVRIGHLKMAIAELKQIQQTLLDGNRLPNLMSAMLLKQLI